MRQQAVTSTEEEIPFLESFPSPSMNVTTKLGSPSKTPFRSPSKRAMKITQTQKQALIDDLQMEITERARKLRAQYALQAQGLRSRIELRINRIPFSLRKKIMGDLYAKHKAMIKGREDKNKAKDAMRAPVAGPAQALQKPTTLSATGTTRLSPYKAGPQASSPVRTRGTKRNSDEMDKENDPQLTITNPKRRRPAGNDVASGLAVVTRNASRAILNPAQVLSPKSNNSRTFSHPPIRPFDSPLKTTAYAKDVEDEEPHKTPAPQFAKSVPAPSPSPVKDAAKAKLEEMVEHAKTMRSTRTGLRSTTAPMKRAVAAATPKTGGTTTRRRNAGPKRIPFPMNEEFVSPRTGKRTVSNETTASNDSVNTVVNARGTRAATRSATATTKTLTRRAGAVAAKKLVEEKEKGVGRKTTTSGKRAASKKVVESTAGRRTLRKRN